MKKQIKEKKNHNIKKKTRHLIGIKEFIFNIVSLVFALSVVLYFGGRCFYYYSLQSQEKKAASMTLNGMILDTNPLVKEGDGLHQVKDGYMFIHPDPEQQRSITIREAACLMTFPMDYQFLGSTPYNFKMIGNAVPVLFAKAIATGIYKLLDKKKKK